MEDKGILVNPPYFLIIGLSLPLSFLLMLSSRIHIGIRIFLVFVLLFILLFLSKRIRLSTDKLVEEDLFGIRKRQILFGEIKKVYFKKGARASLPFSFRFISTNPKKRDITFNIYPQNKGSNIIQILTLIIEKSIPIEKGSSNMVHTYYDKARRNIELSKKN